MSVFKAYDIRGTYPDQLNEQLFRKIGYHLGRYLGSGSVVVGHDMRPSSPSLASELTEGLRDAGIDVVSLGRVTTPMVYFATGRLNAQGGAVITASHNPAGYNGLKLCREQAIPIGSTSGLDLLQRAVEADEPIEPVAERGGLTSHDIVSEFGEFLREQAGELKPFKIAIDTGNGTVGPFVEELLKGLPLSIVPLYFEPDGTFPNHEANPLKLENLVDLQAAVLREGCDLGIAFDGDGDRAALVDERGEPVRGDSMTALLARQALAANGGQGTVLYDLRSSGAVREEILKAGGNPIETRVGHAFIKAAMREHDALFAGELSGHYYFRETLNAESSFLAALRILKEMSATGRPLSELVGEVDRYPRTGEVNFHVEDKDGAIARLAETFGDAEITRLDGITLRYESWWANVRKSNTEPVLRLNLEANDEPMLATARARVIEAIGAEPEA
ncbi:MAG: phosphomannomutase/phosphoglucomutase [Planctomycetota bacterium]|jgi:phosphomannomutase